MTTTPGPESSVAAGETLDRRLTYATAAAAVLLFLPLLIPLTKGAIFSLDDLSAFQLPLRYLYQRALESGHSLIWTSQMFSGFYVHAEGQLGAFHPLHLLLYGTMPLTIAFNLELILSYVFAFAGMFRFLSHRNFSTASSVMGATGFAFSGFALLHLPHMNAIAIVAHTPWLLLAIDLSVSEDTGRRRQGLIAISLLFASQGLLGYPQYVWMSSLICLLYALICASDHPFSMLRAGIASAGGLLLAGVQLGPSFDLLSTSVRRLVGTDFSLSYSLHPLNLLQFFSPYLLLNRIYAPPSERIIHEFALYDGALATIAFTWALIRRRKLPSARLTAFAAVVSIVGLLLALGRYGGVYEWFTMMPLIGKFRAPTRHIVLVHFGLALLVAILFEDMRRLSATRGARSRDLSLLWMPLLISLGTAAAAYSLPQIWTTFPDQQLYADGMVVGAALLAFVTLLVRDALRGSALAFMLLPFIAAADVALWAYPYAFAAGTHTVDDLARFAAPPPAASPGSTVHQTVRSAALNGLLLHDLRVLRPYVGLRPERALTLQSDDELAVSGAQWVAAGTGWRRIAEPMPRVRVVPDWRIVENVDSVGGIDIRQTALVTQDPHATPGNHATARVAVDEPGHIDVDVSARGRALLVTTEAYDRGWRATAGSGAPLQTLAAYGDYLAVVVEPGEYRLSLAFEPASLRIGIYASLLGLLVIAAVTASVSPRRQGQPRT